MYPRAFKKGILINLRKTSSLGRRPSNLLLNFPPSVYPEFSICVPTGLATVDDGNVKIDVDMDVHIDVDVNMYLHVVAVDVDVHVKVDVGFDVDVDPSVGGYERG